MVKELSNVEIVRLLGQRFKQYRLILGFTQKELSELTAISVPTIQKFEAGTANNISLTTLLALMRHVGIINYAENLIPQQPENPYGRKRITKIRHASKRKV